MSDLNDRLDSWKAISEYLNRDVRTLGRWEGHGLPVRRVAGGRGNSVFAFKAEIDEWLRSGGPDRPRMAEPPEPPKPHGRRLSRWGIAAAIVCCAVVLGWRTFEPNAAPQQLDVSMSPSAIVATAPDGGEVWRYDFPAHVTNLPAALAGATRVVAGPRPAVFAITSYRKAQPGSIPMSGLLRQFSMLGQLQRTFEFGDRWTFAGTAYEGPWAITDAQIDDSFGRRHIAVAAHHLTWWPSVVTILDERFQRQSTFVNSGWVDALRWISPDRLAIAGFSEALDGGMFGVLDTRDFDGASPEPPGTKFICDDCRSGRPVLYVVFPRSELNRVTGSRFNRAFVNVSKTGVTIRTDEVALESNVGSLVEAVYEFSPSLELLSAAYGGRYWDKHHALELEGKIKHTRAECPERDGPPIVKVWARDTGWANVRPSRYRVDRGLTARSPSEFQ